MSLSERLVAVVGLVLVLSLSIALILVCMYKESDECIGKPCKHGACADGYNEFTCTCEAGYTGHLCEINEDDCEPNPCQNGGACTDLVAGYECRCPVGYEGRDCLTSVDDCVAGACVHGTCTDGVNSFTCECQAGWEGENCDINADDCGPENPCQNGGTCTDLVGGYDCRCPAGFEGHDCVTNTDECAGSPASPCVYGACVDGVDSFTCSCEPGYTGALCDVEVDECVVGVCVHGNCTDALDSYHCVCAYGWVGDHCDENFDDCGPENPCQNGGTCTDQVAGYVCHCPAGYEGHDCVTNVDECASSPCVHGSCEDGVDGFTCHCETGFKGQLCDVNINDCVDGVCLHGTCTDGADYFICECDHGWEGENCDKSVDDCRSNSCYNGGTCVDLDDDFFCHCLAYYDGARCQTRRELVDCEFHASNGAGMNGLYSTPYDDAVMNCDVADGGWAVILRRVDKSVSFNRGWAEYEEPFGDVDGNYWAGFANAHSLLNYISPALLMVKMETFEGEGAYALYSDFGMGIGEVDGGNYANRTLYFNQYNGTAGNAFHEQQHANFSTFDEDHDLWDDIHCASKYNSPNWHFVMAECFQANPFGQYYDEDESHASRHGIIWSTFKGYDVSLKTIEMKVRKCEGSGMCY